MPTVQTCTNASDGYAVDYPDDWHVRSEDQQTCRFFHPRPFREPGPDGVSDIALYLRFVPPPLEEVRRIEQANAQEVLSSARRQAGERPAVRQKLLAGADGLLPPGSRVTQWLVEFESRTMIASTSDVAAAGTYEDRVAVLDAVMQSMRRVERPPMPCSAQGMAPELEPQPGLPAAVQETRQQIHRAAVQCDLERLEDLAAESGFTYSFGGGDDPAGFWRRAERREGGDPPMRYLAGLLQRPYGQRQVQGTTHYAWPSAFTYDSWASVPQRDREALEPLYDEQDFESFAQFGGYLGYRVVIEQDGTWIAFVAGD